MADPVMASEARNDDRPERSGSERSGSERSETAAPAPQKRFLLRTFGCQMNVYDSERMTEQLGAAGYAQTERAEDADLVVLNTCHIREKAAEKVYSDLGRYRELKEARAAAGLETVIAVAGCVAQAEGAEIVRRAPAVDVVVGPQAYHRLPALIARSRATAKSQIETQFPDDEKFSALPPRTAAPRTATAAKPGTVARTAFLTVQEGCDKFCTFCVVPYTRGAEYSRSAADIEAEARRLVERGVREVTLLGQNVNAYHGTGANGTALSLAGLMRQLANVDGLARLRYMTSHPRDMGDDLIAAHADLPQLMPYLHLPFQSGADRILAAMNRKHTAADYLRAIERVRRARPDIALSTDVIVGFPSETDAEFKATLALVREVGFAQSYSFKYSPRPGTPAATMDGQIDEETKLDRLHQLQELLMSQQIAFNASCVGKTLPVLFERAGRHAGQIIGRSPYLQSVHVMGDMSAMGEVLDVAITGAGNNSLSGDIVA